MANKETLIVQAEGVTLELLLWRYFRRATPGLVEQALDTNPGLPRLPVELPIGTRVVVVIPDAAVTPIENVVSLWD